MPDYDEDEILGMVIEAIADNRPGDDADVIELPVEDEGRRSGRACVPGAVYGLGSDQGGSDMDGGIDGGTLVVIMLIGGLIGGLIGRSKDRAGLGFVLGALLGIIGWVIILFVKAPDQQRAPSVGSPLRAGDARVPCPYCAEPIMAAASVCPHCRRDVTPAVLPPPPDGTPEGWLPDPSGRFPDRWWGGAQAGWQVWVRDKPGGTRSEDPPYLRT